MNPEILGALQTVARLHQFKKDLLLLRDTLYRTDTVLQDKARSSLTSEYQFLNKDDIRTPDQIDRFVAQIEYLGRTSSTVHVVSAIPLDNDVTNIVYNSLNSTVKKPILLSLEVKESILGGLVFVIDGKQFDHSLLKIARAELPPTQSNHV